MKTYYNLCSIFATLCLFASCNNNGDELLNAESLANKQEARIPYISPEMQEIIAMLDTCTTAIPFEKLVPATDSILLYATGLDGELIQTKAVESLTAKGYTYYSVLYSLKQTTFNETQVANFGLNYPNKTYYVTCYAVEMELTDERTLIRRKVQNESMGIDPNDLDQRGFSITDVVPGVIKKFTTYAWAITTTNTNYVYLDILPRVYNSNGSNVITSEIGDWASFLTWNYYAY